MISQKRVLETMLCLVVFILASSQVLSFGVSPADKRIEVQAGTNKSFTGFIVNSQDETVNVSISADRDLKEYFIVPEGLIVVEQGVYRTFFSVTISIPQSQPAGNYRADLLISPVIQTGEGITAYVSYEIPIYITVTAPDDYTIDENQTEMNTTINDTNTTINETINQTINDTVNETMNETVNETINETINSTLNDTINDTLDDTINYTVINDTITNITLNETLDNETNETQVNETETNQTGNNESTTNDTVDVVIQETVQPAIPRRSGGGGGGSGSGRQSSASTAQESWDCKEWSECKTGKQEQICTSNDVLGVSKKNYKDCTIEEKPVVENKHIEKEQTGGDNSEPGDNTDAVISPEDNLIQNPVIEEQFASIEQTSKPGNISLFFGSIAKFFSSILSLIA